MDGRALRIAAARGLVASGLEDDSEIDDVAAALVEAGIGDAGTRTSVIVREVRGPRGRTEKRLTTDSHVTRETRLIELARTAATDRSGALTVSEIEAAAATAGLDFSGAHGARPGRGHAGDRHSCFRPRIGPPVRPVPGRPRLAPLVSAWTARGYRVHGTAVAWRQASALADAGVPREALPWRSPRSLLAFEAARCSSAGRT